jgi:hypothetical protein
MLYPVLTLIAWRFKITLLSGSENSSTSNIKYNPDAYCLDLQRTSKIQRSRIKRKGVSSTSLLNTSYWRVWSNLLQRKDLHSSIIETDNKEYCPGTMNIYFIWYRLELKRLSRKPWHDLALNKMLNIDCLCSTCQVCQMTKKERIRKKYGLLPPKIE